jgi:hypothetical protein
MRGVITTPVIWILSVLALSGCGSKPASPSAASASPGSSRQIIEVPVPTEIQEYLVDDEARKFGAELKAELLTQEPGEKRLIVRGVGRYYCGATGNCSRWLFREGTGRYSLEVDLGSVQSVTIETSGSPGTPRIIFSRHDSAFRSGLFTFEFDGRRYRLVKCEDSDYQDPKDIQKVLKNPIITPVLCRPEEGQTRSVPSDLAKFLESNPDYRLLEFEDLGGWRKSYQEHSDWKPFDVSDTNIDGLPDTVAVVVKKSGDHKFNVVGLHGSPDNGRKPEPLWVIKDDEELILSVEARMGEFWAIVCRECDANSPMVWVGDGYEWGAYSPGTITCLLDFELYAQPNAGSTRSKLEGLRPAEVLERAGKAPNGERWYRVRNLESEPPFTGWVMKRRKEQPETC